MGILVLLAMGWTWGHVFGQNVVVSGALVGNGSYPTLTAAFAAINGGAQTGAVIQVSVVGNTSEGTTQAILNQGAWSSLMISPSGGSWTISGTTSASPALVRLYGADNVTIDGLNTSGNALTIRNDMVSSSVASPAIQLENDASNNVITRCSLKGSAVAVVLIGTGSVTGNDNNVISSCDVGPATTGTPLTGILCQGTNTNTLSNSNTTITNCDIHDFFGNTGLCNGVNLSAGYTGWTISNNRLYQTVARTNTQTVVHHGVRVDGGPPSASATITGNRIGYASSNGTGSWDLTGNDGTRLRGIYVGSVPTTAQIAISGNTISNMNLTGTMQYSIGSFVGIECLGGILTIDGNRIGSASTAGAIQYHTSMPSTSAAMAAGILVNGAVSCSITNDTVAGILLDTPNNGTLEFNGISTAGLTTGPSTITGNVVGTASAPISNNTTNPFGRMAGIKHAGVAANIQNNLVSYVSMGNGASGSGFAAALIGISANGANGGLSQVSGNTVQALSIAGTTGTAELVGICFEGYLYASPSNYVQGNKVQNLVYSNPTGIVTGIYNKNGNNAVQNNMVRLGMDLQGNPISAGLGWIGIHSRGGSHYIYHNSVYIGGSLVSGSANTYAFKNDVDLVSNRILNNIFMNARSNGSGTGKHYAMQLYGNTVNTIWNYSDYNNIIATGNGGVFSSFAGSDWPNVYVWRNIYGHDMHSVTVDPGFVNPMGSVSTGDLHLGPISAMEGAGTLLATVTTDYDGQTRSGLSPNDMGADAANVASIVSLSPAISYTAPSFYCLSGDLTFSATIVLAAGVPTTGTLRPKVYYRKNNGAVQGAYGTLTAGTGTNGTWSFSILAANVGGFVPGDVMSYYVIAQDVSGTYVSGSPGRGLIALDVNTVQQHPWEWNTYGALQGTYGVGAGQTFTTLTGAVEAYNRSCLLGPARFALKDTVYYYERFPITVKANPDAAPNKVLTIQPDSSVVPSICGESSSYLFDFDGADYVTLNGSNTNIANSVCPRVKAQRHLKLRNTGGFATVALHNTTLGDSATHNKVMNCRVYGGRNPDRNNLTGDCAIAITGDAYLTPGNRNNDNVIENNYASFARLGIVVKGAGSGSRNKGVVIRLNDVGMDQWVQDYGIQLLHAEAPVIHANNVSAVVYGISLGLNAGLTTTTTSGSEVIGADVRYNLVRTTPSQIGYSTSAIVATATNSGTTTIANNFLEGVVTSLDEPQVCAAIYHGGGAGLMRIYHNTVRMTGSTSVLFFTFDPIMALAIAGPSPNVDVRNNVLHVSPSNGCMDNNVIGLGYTSTVGSYAGLLSNYNDLARGSWAPHTGRVGNIGPTGTTFGTIAQWNAQTGADLNSVNITPVYLGPNDSHLPAASNATLNNLGTALPLVTDDIDCEPRNPTTPDMGADEMELCPSPVAGSISSNMTFCGPGSATLVGSGYSTGSQYRWQSSPAGLNTWTNTTGTLPSSYSTGTVTASTDFRLQVGCASGSYVYSNVVTVTILPASPPTISIGASVPNPICPGNGVTYTATISNGGPTPTYQWYLNGSPVGINSPTYVLGAATNGDQVRCTVTSSGGCVAGSTVNSNTLTAVVSDVVSPVWANCPSSQSVPTGSTSCTAVVSWNAPTASDNCSVASTGSSHSPGSTFGLGATLVTYTATDLALNTGTCNFTVTVTDQQAPVANCQGAALVLDSTGQASLVVSAIDNGSLDNCGVSGMGLSQSSFGCSDVGTNLVVLTVTDMAGNTGSCVATVTVAAPAMQLAATVTTLSCGYQTSCSGVTDGTASVQVAGGCPGYTYLWSNGATTPTATNLGAGNYMVTVTDGSGNQQVATVTILSPPVLGVQGTVMGTCPGDSTGEVVVFGSGGNDCLPYSYQWNNGASAATVTGLAAGNYTLSLTDVQGCVVVQSWTVGSFTAPVPSFVQSGNLLTASQVWSSYQWLLGGNVIPGATGPTYTITQSGSYSLQVTDTNGCEGVSNPVLVVGVEGGLGALDGLTLYPNPTRDAFGLRTWGPISWPVRVTLSDMFGRVVWVNDLDELADEVVYDIRGLAAGPYHVRVDVDGGGSRVFQLVVQ